MKLREPRTTIPESDYLHDFLKLFHPLMFAPILMLVVIGSFLSKEIHYDRLILTLVGVFFAVLCAYHLDEFIEKVTAPNVPEVHNYTIAYISGISGTFIGIYMCIKINPMLFIPILIALMGVVLYNMDIIKSRILYALSWGGCPVFGSYMVQSGELPNLTVIVFTVFGMLLAIKLFWNWSLRTCGRGSICPKIEWYLGDYITDCYCHSPNTMKCFDRMQVPSEVNDTMKILQKVELLILFMVMMGVILL